MFFNETNAEVLNQLGVCVYSFKIPPHTHSTLSLKTLLYESEHVNETTNVNRNWNLEIC